MGRIQTLRGNWPGAIASFQRALALEERTGDRLIAPIASSGSGWSPSCAEHGRTPASCIAELSSARTRRTLARSRSGRATDWEACWHASASSPRGGTTSTRRAPSPSRCFRPSSTPRRCWPSPSTAGPLGGRSISPSWTARWPCQSGTVLDGGARRRSRRLPRCRRRATGPGSRSPGDGASQAAGCTAPAGAAQLGAARLALVDGDPDAAAAGFDGAIRQFEQAALPY